MKRPSFQFYPADWRKDAALQSCSLAAQGLWVNLLCIAHECEPYGHMTINGRPMTVAQISRLVGLTVKDCEKLLAELRDAGVSSVSDEGALFSRRMVRDEDLRNRRAEGGKAGSEHGIKGAEHGAKGGRPPKGRGVSEPPIEPPPSSSSSSSSSSDVGRPPQAATRAMRLPADWEPGPEGMAFAAGLGLANGRAATELDRFRDFWTAKSGKDATKADWLATWRNWVRKAVEIAPPAAGTKADSGRHYEVL